MWAWLVKGGQWAAAAVGALTGLITKAIFGLVMWLSGRRYERQKRAEDTARVKDEQLEIAAKPARHRRSLLDRMWRRKRDD